MSVRQNTTIHVAALIAVVLLAFGLRLHGIDWGLPAPSHPDYSYHPDERFTLMWSRWLVQGDVIAKHFIYGGTLYYSMLNAYIFFARLAGDMLQGINLLADAILIGRYFHVFVAIVTLLVLYECSRLLFGRTIGLIAALLLAVAPAHVVYSQLIRPDTIGVLITTLGLYLAAKVLTDARLVATRLSIYIGILSGAALAFRFPLLLFMALPVVALYFRLRQDRADPQLWRRLGHCVSIIVLVSIIAYVVFSPHTVLYFAQAVQGVRTTYTYESSIFLDAFENGPLVYQHFGVALPQALGYIACLVGLIGIVYAAIKRTPADIVILGGIVLYAALMVNASWVVARYALPLLPLLALLGARVSVDGLCAGAPVATRIMAGVFLTVAVVSSLAASLAFTRMEASINVRDVAAEWINQHVSPGSTMLMAKSYIGDDFFNPPLSDRHCVAEMLFTQDNDSISLLRGRRYDYVVLHEILYRSLDRLGERYPYEEQRKFYVALQADYTLEREFKLSPSWAGIDFSAAFTVNDYVLVNPGIRIYRRRR